VSAVSRETATSGNGKQPEAKEPDVLLTVDEAAARPSCEGRVGSFLPLILAPVGSAWLRLAARIGPRSGPRGARDAPRHRDPHPGRAALVEPVLRRRALVRPEEAGRLWHEYVHVESLLQFGNEIRVAFLGRVDIRISCTFGPGQRRLDPDNLCAKMAIDGLKRTFLRDDGPNFVRSVTLGPCTKGPAPLTLIRIEEVA